MQAIKHHILAAATAMVWGTTLVSSKVLLQSGMSPAEILLSRLVLAYLFLWILHPRWYRAQSLYDEIVFLLAGFLGGTLYFLLENTALVYTQATNVGLICATVPLVTAVFSQFLLGEKRLNVQFVCGTILAFIGVALVILNGRFVLNLNPLGDILTLLAVVAWSLYCVSLRFLKHEYHSIFITRKVFSYCIITLLPYFLYKPFHFSLQEYLQPQVWSNLLFLGLVASSLCFLVWTIAIKKIGVVATNSYIYVMPIITIVTATLLLDEHLTIFVIVGSLLIIAGLWWSSAKNLGWKVLFRKS